MKKDQEAAQEGVFRLKRIQKELLPDRKKIVLFLSIRDNRRLPGIRPKEEKGGPWLLNEGYDIPFIVQD